MESTGSGTLHTLISVVEWLHSQGFYAAESALLGEVENKYPDHPPRSPSQAIPLYELAPTTEVPPDEDTVDLSTNSCLLEEALADDAPSSAERYVPPPPL